MCLPPHTMKNTRTSLTSIVNSVKTGPGTLDVANQLKAVQKPIKTHRHVTAADMKNTRIPAGRKTATSQDTGGLADKNRRQLAAAQPSA